VEVLQLALELLVQEMVQPVVVWLLVQKVWLVVHRQQEQADHWAELLVP
jgi:hypothetical protein